MPPKEFVTDIRTFFWASPYPLPFLSSSSQPSPKLFFSSSLSPRTRRRRVSAPHPPIPSSRHTCGACMRFSPESRLGGRPVLAAPPQAFFDWLRSPKGRRSRPPRISFAGVSGRASVARGGACRRARPGAVLSALLVWLYQRFSSGSISASRLALSELLVWLSQSLRSYPLSQRFSSGLSALLVWPLSASRPASQRFSSGLSELLVWPLSASRLARSQSFSRCPDLRASRPALSAFLVRPALSAEMQKSAPELASWERWAAEVDTNPASGWPPGLPVRGVGKVGVSSTCSNATELRPAVRNVQGTPRPRLRRSRKP